MVAILFPSIHGDISIFVATIELSAFLSHWELKRKKKLRIQLFRSLFSNCKNNRNCKILFLSANGSDSSITLNTIHIVCNSCSLSTTCRQSPLHDCDEKGNHSFHIVW